MAIKESPREKVEIQKALARADCFWGIICDAGIKRSLAMKIADNVPFSKLEDKEKLILVKVSTLLVRGANEIETQFAQKESEAESEETQDQIEINDNAQETEVKQETQSEETTEAAAGETRPENTVPAETTS